MSLIDFSPLFRSTVGFDRFARLAEEALDTGNRASYPPYNIERQGDHAYRITLAVAGFDGDELDVEARENALVISGEKAGEGEEAAYLFKGIAGRNFKRVFRIADHVRIDGANLVSGLLTIDLVHEIPEEKKPRRIAIGSDSEGLTSKTKKLFEGTDEKAA